MRKIYTALDIGSNYIKLIVGEFINHKLNILCAKKGISRGFYFNQITDEEPLATIHCLSDVCTEVLRLLFLLQPNPWQWHARRRPSLC